MENVTIYSEVVKGDDSNYEWSVRFDKTRPEKYIGESGCIGINQYETDGKLKERVLLSPEQMRVLIKFAQKIHLNP